MKKIITVAVLTLFTNVLLLAQLNLSLLGQLDYSIDRNTECSDIWAYVDGSGNEYALVGIDGDYEGFTFMGGCAVVDVTDPTNPTEVFFTEGEPSIWRDIKTWNGYAYVTNESGGGLQIIDLNSLPDASGITVSFYNTGGWQSAHNLYIDENGICYIFGANRGNGGVIMLDLTDPVNPVEIGDFDDYYVHDGMARGDTLYTADILEGHFSVLNVSDKSSPVVMATQTTPLNFSHNVWISDDGKHIYNTDEKPNSHITAYNISDLTNIQETDRVQSNPGTSTIVHNTHFMDDYVITSYYRDGVTVHDVTHPDNIIEVGNYDTSPLSGNGFDGAWGTYPWLPSGNIIVSDIDHGLFVFSANYTRGCYLEGNVTSSADSSPLFNVEVIIETTSAEDQTNIVGDYKTGLPVAGTYTVTFSKFGFIPKTETGVSLTNGVTTLLDVELDPLVPFVLTGTVTDAATTLPIEGADVLVYSEFETYTATTGSDGTFSINDVYESNYTISFGKWGYVTDCSTNGFFGASNDVADMELSFGYYDDFTFDSFGWNTSGTALGGMWEVGPPNGTNLFGIPMNPSEQAPFNCSDQAFVTGNSGTGATDDDIDGGNVVLTSPSFDGTLFTNPYVSFYYWYSSFTETDNDLDSVKVSVFNGTDEVVLDYYSNPGIEIDWEFKSYELSNFITPTSTMNFTIEAFDGNNIIADDKVEAGLDVFRVTEGDVTGITVENPNEFLPSVYPNPFTNELIIELSEISSTTTYLEILDLSGRQMVKQPLYNLHNRISPNLVSGVYFVKVAVGNKHVIHKIVKY